MLAIPTVVSIVVFLGSLSIYQHELDHSNAESLDQLRLAMDHYVDEVLKTSVQIETNESLGELIYTGSLEEITRSYAPIAKILDLNRDINVYSFSSGLIQGVMVAFQKADVVWYDYSIYSRHGFIQQRFPQHPEFEQEWEHLFLDQADHEFRRVPFAERGGQPTVALVHSIPILSSAPLANVIVYLDEARFLKAAEAAQRWPEAVVEVVDQDRTILFSTGHGSNDGLVSQMHSWGSSSGVETVLRDGKPMVVSHIRSQNSQWTYLLAVPEAVYTSKFQTMLGLLFTGLIVCVGLGAWTVRAMARRNYRPLKKVLGLLGVEPSSGRNAVNEFDLISESLARLKTQDVALQENFLMRLLTERALDPSDVEERARALGIGDIQGHYVLLLVYISADSSLLAQPHQDTFEIRRMVGERLQHRLEVQGRLWQTSYAEMAVFFVFQDGVEPWRPRWTDSLGLVVGDLRQEGLHTGIAVSGVAEGASGAQGALRQCLDALEHRILSTGRQVFFFDETSCQPTTRDYTYTVNQERVLTNLLSSGEIVRAQDYVGQLIDELSAHRVDIKIARCLLYDIVGTIMKTLLVNGIELGEAERQALVDVDRFRDASELKQSLVQLLKSVGTRVTDPARMRLTNQLVARIGDAIQNHSSDPNLNVATLAHQFGMNPKYISTVYRHATGESIVDTLHRTRIERAKEFLQDRKLTVQEIAASCGYSGSNTLIRIFKEYEGVTPGQYRTAMADGDPSSTRI